MEFFKKMSSFQRIQSIVYIVAILAVVFSPEAKAQSGNVYGNGQAQIISPSEEGVVLQVSIKRAEPSWQSRAGGAAIGGILGGLLGSNVDGQARAAANMIGATLGGFAGERVANAAFSSDAQEIVVGMKDPRTGYMNRVVTVVQPQPYDAVSVNEQVLVVNTGGTIRVLKRNYNVAWTSQR